VTEHDGFEAWFASMVERYGDRLVGFAQTYTQNWDDAQDIAQEVFLRLLRTRRQRPEASISPGWLYQVAHRLCIDWCRKRRRSASLALRSAECPPMQAGLPDLSLQELLDQLPACDRECLWLLYYEDLSIAEIGLLLDLTPEAVRMRLHRARTHLRALWEEGSHATVR